MSEVTEFSSLLKDNLFPNQVFSSVMTVALFDNLADWRGATLQN